MDSLLIELPLLNKDFLLAGILVAALGGLVLLFLSMLGRRALQYFGARRFDALSFKIHKHWRDMVRGDIPVEEWRKDPMQCDIVRSIVIQ